LPNAAEVFDERRRMTPQMITIDKREFVLLAKRDFQKLAAQAQRQTEDDYWTQAALKAEAHARAKKQKPVDFESVVSAIDAAKSKGFTKRHRRP